MSTLISVRSSGVANIATAPVPASSVVTTATETFSVRSDGDAVSVQGAPVETVIGTEPATLILQVETTSVSVISVNSSLSGGGSAIGAVPTKADKSLTPLSSSGDESATSLNISISPRGAGYVSVSVNGVGYVVGDGVKTTDSYFSADGGTTARTIETIEAGDQLIWNGILSGFELLNSRDRVNFEYDV